MTDKGQANVGENRIYFLDNLRTFIIFLVVVYHAGWFYEKSGILSSVWIVNDPAKNDLAGILNMVLDMVMMPIMFFISGYFTPISLKRKNGWEFLKSRFKRLMVPWIIAVLTLIPLYKIIYLYSRNLPRVDLISYFHFSGEIPISQSWLWFLPVLFVFNLLYLALFKIKAAPKSFSLSGSIFVVFVIGFAYSFGMNFFGLIGWTKTILIDFQNERFLIYSMMFLLGSLCFKQNVFSATPPKKKLYYFICFTIWMPMNIYIIFLINLFLNPGNYIISRLADIAMIWLGFNLSLLGLMYVIINTFRYYFNKKGMLITRLNRYSYGVYIIHFIVMGGFALVLLNTSMGSLAKYAVLILATYTASNVIMFLYKETVQLLWSPAPAITH